MIQKGMVIKLKEKYAIVASDTSDFVRIKRKDGMMVGQKIYFDESDKVKMGFTSVRSTSRRNTFNVLTLAACLMLMAVLVNPFGQKDIPVYAVVTLDINPSFEMTIDRNYQVLSIRAVNEDSKALVDTNLVGKPLDEAIRETVLDVQSSGIEINDKSAILISTVIVEENIEEKKTQEVEKEVVEGLDKAFEKAPVLEETKVVFIEATKEDIEAAKEEDLSVGKYKLIEMSDDADKFDRLDDESIGNLIQNKDIVKELETDKDSIVLDGHAVDDIFEFIESHNFEDEPLGEEWLEDFEDDDFYEDEDHDEDEDYDEDEEYDEEDHDEDDIDDFDEEDFDDDELDFDDDFDEETLEKIEDYIEEEHQEELREIEEMKEALEKEYQEELERIKELEALEEEIYYEELKELEELKEREALEDMDEEDEDSKDYDALMELVESKGIETLEDLEAYADELSEYPEELIEELIEALKNEDEGFEEEFEDDFEEESEEKEDDFEEDEAIHEEDEDIHEEDEDIHEEDEDAYEEDEDAHEDEEDDHEEDEEKDDYEDDHDDEEEDHDDESYDE